MQIDETIREKAEWVLSNSGKTMADALGITFLSLAKDEVVAEMPVDRRTVQPMRILHGGASVALAESVISVGAWLNLENPEQAAVGLEINANHIRSVEEGNRVTGTARPIHLGRSTQVWEANIRDRDENLVSVCRCTLAIITTKKFGKS